MTTENLNLNALTHEALSALFFADQKFVGTDSYMGFAYFWNLEYKFAMRDFATNAQRRRIHKAFLRAGLDIAGASPEHDAIVYRILPR